MEEAFGLQSLITEYGLTQEQAAERVGRSRPAVANSLRLIALPPEVQKMVERGELSAGHARAVLGLKTASRQKLAAQRIFEGELSVRQAEALVKRMAAEDKPKPQKAQPMVDYIAACESELTHRLGRSVKIVNGARKGRFEVEFYGQDDLQRLYEALQNLNIKE
jgi:ParB family chromosome partitioning protein